MKLDSTTKNVEPFNLFGESSTIWNSKNAREVVKVNAYYFYVIIGIHFIQYLNQAINSLHTELERGVPLALVILLLFLTLLVQYKMNRVAAILLFLNFAWNFLDAAMSYVNAIISAVERDIWGMIFMGLMVAVSYRTVQGTIAYAKFENG